MLTFYSLKMLTQAIQILIYVCTICSPTDIKTPVPAIII